MQRSLVVLAAATLAAVFAPAVPAAGQSLPDSRPASAATAPAATAPAADAQLAKVKSFWRRFLIVPVEDVQGMKTVLAIALREVPADNRLGVAEALMGDDADEQTRAAAIEILNDTWGAEWLTPDLIGKIVADPNRSTPARLLVLSAFEAMGDACRSQTQATAPTARQRALAELALRRLEDVQKDMSAPAADWTYAQQRLTIHMLAPALTWAARWPGDPTAEKLWAQVDSLAPELAWASRWYSKPILPPPAAMLMASIDGWARLHRSSNADVLAALGHWDASARWRAAVALAKRMDVERTGKSSAPTATAATSPAEPATTLEGVRLALDDPRDEVKAAAAMALSFAPAAGGDELMSKLGWMLLQERGLAVQISAAEALMVRCDRPLQPLMPMLEVFQTSRPGPGRTGLILTALSRLAPRVNEKIASQLARLALDELPVAPRGAMDLLEALSDSGMLAKTGYQAAAVAAVDRYRLSATRIERQHIDGHVLPAIKK